MSEVFVVSGFFASGSFVKGGEGKDGFCVENTVGNGQRFS